jgi:uncharacterized protein involved in type VI secretion and phage assembly
MNSPFYGKYRGIVTNNRDPEQLGRIRARVPDVMGDNESGWALPCAAFGGSSMGFFSLPDEGAGVWIEFEQGDPEYPIWSGCWWGSRDQMPAVLQSLPEEKVLIKTKGGHTLLLNDSQGQEGITLETSGGQKIVLSSQSIEINNGNGASLKLTGNQVSINDGALEVI